MFFSKLWNSIACFTLLHATVICINSVKYEITYRNKCLLSDFMIRYFVHISLSQCVKECALRTICQSINYKKRQLLCELYLVEDGEFINNGFGTEPCVFVRRSTFVPQILPSCTCGEMETCDIKSVSCSQTECPQLTLDKGTIIGNQRVLGSKVKISCDSDYLEVENMTYATCNSTGEWSYKPRCIAVSCSTSSLDFSKLYTNVALKKTVTLSSVHHPGSFMVDGILNANDENCAHTDNEMNSNEYAVIDLEHSYTIYALYIVNRQDCCSNRLRNVSITIGDNMDDLKLHVFHENPIGNTCTFVMAQPCRGRYVKILNDKNASLTICELQVYGN